MAIGTHTHWWYAILGKQRQQPILIEETSCSTPDQQRGGHQTIMLVLRVQIVNITCRVDWRVATCPPIALILLVVFDLVMAIKEPAPDDKARLRNVKSRHQQNEYHHVPYLVSSIHDIMSTNTAIHAAIMACTDVHVYRCTCYPLWM